MKARLTVLALVGAAAIGGCGDDSGPPSASGTATSDAPGRSPNDKRTPSVDCFNDRHHLDARTVGEKSIQIGPGTAGPRIAFFQSSLEAEGHQFEGKAEGSEQVGAALVYVKDADEALIEKIEDCLNDVQ